MTDIYDLEISTRRGCNVMNEKTETTNKAKERGTAVTELLFAIATLAAAVVVAAMSEPKIPTYVGD